MAVLNSSTLDGDGIEKEIDASSMGLIMRTLQASQYKYPIKSFIRETVSNCVDAVNEKKTSLDILNGDKKVEDIYVSFDGDASQKSSVFDASYYDAKYLDPVDKVTIQYINRLYTSRSLIRITDTGVGIGGDRLKGFFNLGFSTKRLSTNALGCFGKQMFH